ncbi:AAA-type ATPase family protein isoform X2 [Wolffia australiana]
MMEGRRHSVDVPLAKTLAAMRRVRSLRDPETSSMDTYSMHMENVSWETNSACDPILKLGDHRSEAETEFREYNFRSSSKIQQRPYLSPINSNVPCTPAMDSGQRRCGLTDCWSRTPRNRDWGGSSDEEEVSHPLLEEEVEGNSCPENPRSLNQKYRPRTFDELVGQPVLVQSLRNAISKRKIWPFYLFHGPHGTGKTSAAKIFASGLNCSSLDEKLSRDITVLDPSRINSKESLRTCIRKALRSPISSNYRVFIIDDCENLSAGAWTAILNAPPELHKRVIFILVTSDLEKLPRDSLSSCQKYQFQKIKEPDIVQRLKKICRTEGIDYEDDALAFIAGRSGGSLREAETTLEQISLLGKKVTLSLAQELSGVVSEPELLDLLDVALSSDAPNTVRKAREMMSSKVDPMQLTSQLANLIMDILAGRCQTPVDVGFQTLRNALKVLSETEKQLRSSSSRATWLTVALLQLNTGDSTSVHDSSADDKALETKKNEERALESISRSLSARNEELDAIWKKTVEFCGSDLSKSLLKKGRLTSIHLKHELAIAHVEFSSSEMVSRAECSLKAIASSLQSVLCRNVELKISLARCSSFSKTRELTQKWLRCKSVKRQSSHRSRADNEEDKSTEKAAQMPVKGHPWGTFVPLPWKFSLETFFCPKARTCSKQEHGIPQFNGRS